jgi:integrase
VFSTGNGTPISASNMLRSSFYPICERAGIPTRPGLRFHDLRHSAGSLLIQAGVRPKDVQAIWRHSKVSTTMDLYVERELVGKPSDLLLRQLFAQRSLSF